MERTFIRHGIAFLLSAQLLVASAWAAPGYGPPLDEIQGRTFTVATANALRQALSEANSAKTPATILVDDGVYTFDSTLHVQCPGLLLRSLNGDRTKVLIRGPDEGPNATLPNVFLISANDVTIADISFGYCRWHGVQVRGEEPWNVEGFTLRNCHVINCNEQFFKGSSGPRSARRVPRGDRKLPLRFTSITFQMGGATLEWRHGTEAPSLDYSLDLSEGLWRPLDPAGLSGNSWSGDLDGASAAFFRLAVP